jgi:hypothetical protein
MELNERHEIKRKYGQYEAKRINAGAPIRDSIVTFVGKRFVTEDELKTHLEKLSEQRGGAVNGAAWFKNNKKYFESFTNRGQNVVTLSKYGKRVFEFILATQKAAKLNEGKNYDAIVDVLTNSMEEMNPKEFAEQIKDAGFNPKKAQKMFDAYWDLGARERSDNTVADWEDFITQYESIEIDEEDNVEEGFNFLRRENADAAKTIAKTIKKYVSIIGEKQMIELLDGLATDFKIKGETGIDQYIK